MKPRKKKTHTHLIVIAELGAYLSLVMMSALLTCLFLGVLVVPAP